MGAAVATIGNASLAAQRDTAQVKAGGGTGFCAQRLHHAAPLFAVWPHVRQAMQPVGDIVRHFVRNRRLQPVLEVARKNIRVVADHRLATRHPVHARGAAMQIKQHGNRLVSQPEQAFGTLQAGQCRGANLLALRLIDGLNRQGVHWRKNSVSLAASWH